MEARAFPSVVAARYKFEISSVPESAEYATTVLLHNTTQKCQGLSTSQYLRVRGMLATFPHQRPPCGLEARVCPDKLQSVNAIQIAVQAELNLAFLRGDIVDSVQYRKLGPRPESNAQYVFPTGPGVNKKDNTWHTAS